MIPEFRAYGAAFATWQNGGGEVPDPVSLRGNTLEKLLKMISGESGKRRGDRPSRSVLAHRSGFGAETLSGRTIETKTYIKNSQTVPGICEGWGMTANVMEKECDGK
jgi:hypothetical protein